MYASRPCTNRTLYRRSIQEIQQKIEKLARKNEFIKYFTASNLKGKIAGWRVELDGILRIFNVC